MVIVQCKYCGKEIDAMRTSRQYCDSRCYEKYRWKHNVLKHKVLAIDEDLVCLLGVAGIECDKKQCSKCGWNPEVAARRLEKFRAKREEQYGK